MGSYAYCHTSHCTGSMDKPTLREAFTNEWRCPVCYRDHSVDDYVRAELLGDLEDRVKAVEDQLGIKP